MFWSRIGVSLNTCPVLGCLPQTRPFFFGAQEPRQENILNEKPQEVKEQKSFKGFAEGRSK